MLALDVLTLVRHLFVVFISRIRCAAPLPTCPRCSGSDGGSWSVDDVRRLLVDSLHRHLAQARVVDLPLVVGLLVERVHLVLDAFVLVRRLDRTRVVASDVRQPSTVFG